MITRFAPSMSGYLHIGHVLHLLYLKALSRIYTLSIELRIEDHDIIRYRNEYKVALFNDLKFLGFEWKNKPVYQSKSKVYYDLYLDQLNKIGLVYGCSCSRSEIKRRQKFKSDELVYDDYCSLKNLPLHGNTVRFRVKSKSVNFYDGLQGLQSQIPKEQCGDFSIRDRDGNYTYQFACVCDDIRQNITHVIRGKDILTSTSRQMLLFEALNYLPPKYFHHSLKLDKDNVKLSKRNNSVSINEIINQGAHPEDIFSMALDTPQPINLDDAVEYLIKKYKDKIIS